LIAPRLAGAPLVGIRFTAGASCGKRERRLSAMSMQFRVLPRLLLMMLPVLFLSDQWSKDFIGWVPEARRRDKASGARVFACQSEILAAAFPSIRPVTSFGTYCWNPEKVKKKLRVIQNVGAHDIAKGLATADEPLKTIVDPTKMSLPCHFAENLPSQRVLNKFPYRPGFLPALRVAKARGLCLKNLDFVLDDISLGFLARRKRNRRKRCKYLVQKLPGTDVIVLGVHVPYRQELHEIGFQFERLMTGEPMDGPHDLRWHGAIQLLDIGGWQVLAVAEVQAMNSRRMPVVIKSSHPTTRHRKRHILQMLSSGAVELVHAKRNGNTLEDVQVQSFEELVAVAARPKSWTQRVDTNLVAGLSQLKANGDISAELVHEVAGFSSNSSCCFRALRVLPVIFFLPPMW
ncbi:unnamed protein product, partial [Symbiodinium sp. CCMP2456]